MQGSVGGGIGVKSPHGFVMKYPTRIITRRPLVTLDVDGCCYRTDHGGSTLDPEIQLAPHRKVVVFSSSIDEKINMRLYSSNNFCYHGRTDPCLLPQPARDNVYKIPTLFMLLLSNANKWVY